MPREIFGPFLATKPRVSPELLSEGFSQVAINCLLERGLLEASKSPLATGASLASGTKTIYWFNRDANSGNGYWFQWPKEVSVLRGQIANDTYLRTYIFGDGAPKYTINSVATSGGGPYPSVVRTLGLPVPDSVSAAAPSGEPPSGSTKISTSYVVTYVTDIGEESAPSIASNVVDRWDGATVNISGIPIASGTAIVVAKRIYRAEFNGVFQYVGSVGAGTTTFSDNVDSEFLGESVPSTNWDAPSSDIQGAINIPNGGIVGWWKNTLAFCEPYYPHAWPIDYRLALDFDIVGAAVTASGILVCTTGSPYLVTGSTPAGMLPNKLDTIAACVSARSIVDMGEFVIYAGSDGLIAAGGMNAQNISEEFMTAEQWRATISPKTLKAYRYKNYYLGFYAGGSFAFAPGLGFLFFSDTADCAFIDDREGTLYIKQGTELKKWNEGSPLSYTWKSRKIRVNPSRIFQCAKIDAQAYPVQFKLYKNGALIKNLAVNSNKAFRLPQLTGCQYTEFELSGNNPVVNVQLSTSMSELI